MTSATILLSDLRVKDERKYGMRRLLYKMSQTYAYNIFIAVGKAWITEDLDKLYAVLTLFAVSCLF